MESLGMHVLIVDDSRIMRQIVRRSLSRAGFEGFTFSEATNGKEALDCFHSERPDLILSDWNMPEMDGMEFLQAVRGEDPEIPFGFITAQSTAQLRKSALHFGAHFLLSKPFTPEALGAAVHAVLSV
jgi:two-component system, chemotaxis family, chemotaxis protein CheY